MYIYRHFPIFLNNSVWICLLNCQDIPCRGVASGGRVEAKCVPHTHKHTHTQTHTHFNFPTKQGPTNSVSNIRGIAFYWCSEIIRTRNITIFTVCAVIFRQFTVAFNFFKLRRGNRSLHVGPSEKVRYLTLDLLKSLLL